MDFSEHIKIKSKEFREILSNYRNLGVLDTGKVGNSCHIKTLHKVPYKTSGEGKFRFGKINDNLIKNHISIRLDLPKDEFSDRFLMKATGFSEIVPSKQRANFTCIKVRRASGDQGVFDTMDIKLYEDDIATYDFNSCDFLDFINLLVLRATGEIIEVSKG